MERDEPLIGDLCPCLGAVEDDHHGIVRVVRRTVGIGDLGQGRLRHDHGRPGDVVLGLHAASCGEHHECRHPEERKQHVPAPQSGHGDTPHVHEQVPNQHEPVATPTGPTALIRQYELDPSTPPSSNLGRDVPAPDAGMTRTPRSRPARRAFLQVSSRSTDSLPARAYWRHGGASARAGGGRDRERNRGVEALCLSVTDAVDRELHDARLSILDDGWGVRVDARGHRTGTSVELVGVRRSCRWHRPESWAQVRAAQANFPRLNGSPGGPRRRRGPRRQWRRQLHRHLRHARLATVTHRRSRPARRTAAGAASADVRAVPRARGATPRGAPVRRRPRPMPGTRAARPLWSWPALTSTLAVLACGVDLAFALEPSPARIARGGGETEGLAHGRRPASTSAASSGTPRPRAVRDRAATTATRSALVARWSGQAPTSFSVPHVHVTGGRGESDIGAS